ncbi:DNA polymerase III subunit gamma/tau [Vitiosangium sp. GDMCC 1.1324]|uniref:DNA polymerase III subunit gamma/tau n=1 Tax=Vitiosangium sp. (strain GDMCC 1.1324) TaxID=2138576 RepID=UPI000D38A288|nr:DNA polymerase III subunit gamma/tau [Vitiosangium sp. GDMCC 1.1324]PTL79207.1 DNA polymerase III subunit gamma/tau [Vitiosangium sp. GDMCC 1.1324]
MSQGGPAPTPRPPEAPAPAQPVVRVTNVRLPAQPPEPPPPVDDERYFPEEGPADGCASGECLPDAPPVPLAEPEPEPDSVRPFDVHHASGAAASMASMAPSGRDNPRRSLQDRWRATVDTVRGASGRHAKSLACGRLLWIREGEVALAYPPSQGFHKTTVSGGTGRTIVEKALSEHFGRPTKLVVQDCAEGDKAADGARPADAMGTGLISIAEQDAQERAAYEKSTEGRVRSHPALRSTLKFLGGEIEHIQVYDQPARPVAAPANDTPDESP